METVPVTLGAVLPGTTGVPPLFAKAAEAGPSAGLAAGTFMQELQNIIPECSGGPKSPKKADAPVKQNGPVPDEQEKAASVFGYVPITAPPPLSLPLLISLPPQPLHNTVNPKAGAAQNPTSSQLTGVEARLTEVSIQTTTEPEVATTKPALSISVPAWLRLITKRQAPDQTQAQAPSVSAPVLPGSENNELNFPGAVLPQVQPEAAGPVQLPDEKPAEASAAVRNPLSPLGEKVLRSSKEAPLGDARGKTADNYPNAPPVRVLETTLFNFFVAPSSPGPSSERPASSPANASLPDHQPNIQPASPFGIAADVVTAIKAEATTPKVGAAKLKGHPQAQPAQKQESLLPTESEGLSDRVQSFQLVLGDGLNPSAAAPVVADPQESKPARKIGSEPVHAKVSTSISDAPQIAARLQVQTEIRAEIPGLGDANTGLPVTHKPASLETKPLVSDRSTDRDVQPDTKASGTETKPGESAQKANTNSHEASDPTSAATPMQVHPAPQTDRVSASDRDTNALPQIVPAPGAHVPASAPLSTGRPAVPVAAPSDAPALPPLPSDTLPAARLVDRLGHAEMHLGMRTETFGSVQVHTVIRDSQVGLTIGSERGDLKTYLAAEVPGLESNLRQHDLHFSDVRFLANSFSSAGNQSGSGGSQSQSFQQGRTFPQAAPGFTLRSENRNETEPGNDETAGLSIHA